MIIKRHVPLLFGLLILGLVTMIGAQPGEIPGSESVDPASVRTVQVEPVRIETAEHGVTFPGVTRATDRASLSFGVGGRLARRPVEIGDQIRAGQIVAVLDDREYRLAEAAAKASLLEIEARLAQAARDLHRIERLADADAATAEELERASSGVEALRALRDATRARLGETERMRRETEIRAPFSGTITAVHRQPGEWVSTGASVVALAGDESLEIRVDVPETVRMRLRPGSKAPISLTMLDQTTTGTITSVALASSDGGLFPVVLSVDPGPGLVPGLAAEVELGLEGGSATSVPIGAVIDSGSSRPSVFRIRDGQAERVPIELGRVQGDRVTVEGSELSAGDLVAVRGHTSLVDGDSVEVR